MKLLNILKSKTGNGVSNLKNQIVQIIKHTGPINVHNFMREMLTNRDHGYYMNKEVFGEKGDFITSPEVSQLFGELCGVWIVNEWHNQNRPSQLQIVELGPGRGTLMSDALSAIAKFPELFSILSLKFVEISPNLRKCQENVLEKCFSKLGRDVPIEWIDQLDERLPRDSPSCFIAHEFFDALPIHKFRKNENGRWREILIDYHQSINCESNLQFIMSPRDTGSTIAFKNILDKCLSSPDLEFSPLSLSVLENISTRIVESGGFALIADYGHFGDKGDTFRAFRNHQLSDPLENLGESDLTADVNFRIFHEYLQEKFEGKVIISGPITQNAFLHNMGIDLRLKMLLNKCKSQIEVDSLINGYRIMMDPKEMGDRFKFLSILPIAPNYPDGYQPAGFCQLE